MTLVNEIKRYETYDFKKYIAEVTPSDVCRVLEKKTFTLQDFLTLLSPFAKEYIEPMSQRARDNNLKHFGKAVGLYTPIYVSNYCVNQCEYCGFNHDNSIKRLKLSLDEVKKEADEVLKMGLKQVLILSGESNKHASVTYLKEVAKVLNHRFSSIGLEVQPLSIKDYTALYEAGVDGVTVYQETYDPIIYDQVHLSGPKKNYLFRLNTATRACEAGIPKINIGPLLGLGYWPKEVFHLAQHIEYLYRNYPGVELSISLPRIRPHAGDLRNYETVTDFDLVQIISAFKICFPYVGVNISTREDYNFRKNVLPIGINKMSAGVSTEVGGRINKGQSEAQFEITDHSSVKEVKKMILEAGYQPVFKDWF